ncbi:aldehyde dehydrogenase family protein, partial [Hoeflea sp. BAL378]|uniref:aldehyde dehydrogenase family protein n=1 Tax=Hoeflea sp. BAL378 TaxID=1547437 RepID=UPI0031F2E47C
MGPFRDAFVAQADTLRVGPGLDEGTEMGPLVSARRLEAVEALVADAREKGARVELGGKRIGNAGFFHEPTVLSRLDVGMRVMTEEPFGPLALLIPFKTADEALAEANRLPFGLASYAFTGSARTKAHIERRLQAGMLSINHLGLALPETPFGGIKDSGYGTEGGPEAIDAYLTTKFITERH